jgi:hypothetical protein
MAPIPQLNPNTVVSYASLPSAATVGNSLFRVGSTLYYSDGTTITIVTKIATGSTAFRAIRVASGALGVDVCPKVQTLTSGAAIAWDLSLGYTARLTLATNATLSAPTNAEAGDSIVLIVTQDGTGGRTLAYNAVFKWPSGTPVTLTTTAGAIDVLTFVYDGTNWYGTGLKTFS